ncbi:MAG: hypothetical protein H0T95_01320 [Chthoniobacterales bacterium]|nr:hypothetical protein [Chthoniobacterales bacterium]
MRSCFPAFVFAFTLCVLTAKPAEKKEILRAAPNESTKASTSAGERSRNTVPGVLIAQGPIFKPDPAMIFSASPTALGSIA